MISKPWFKAKIYGWGWYPSTWQGWLAMVIYLILLAQAVYSFEISLPDTGAIVNYLIEIVLLTSLLVILCYGTGEKPRWRWGK